MNTKLIMKIMTLALGLFFVSVPARTEAEELPFGSMPYRQPQTSAASAPSPEVPMAPGELETAIRSLTEPVDPNRLDELFSNLSRVEDPQEQERLEQLLDEKLQQLSDASVPTVGAPVADAGNSPSPAGQPLEDWTVEELRARIQSLDLSPDSTVEDLRARDEVVFTIAGIADPLIRDELLKELDAMEHDAQELFADSGS